MDNKKTANAHAGRRHFLRAAGGAGALATLASVAGEGRATEAVAAPASAPEAPASGYRETEHIREYYRTARYW